jgi:Fe-S-cluster-containing hydrogenase component 2
MLEKTGIPGELELAQVLPSADRLSSGPVAIFECFQNIPCNPCADACARGAIKPFVDINDRPQVDWELCNGCGICMTRCPGLAIFVMDLSYSDRDALVKIPYEFAPLPAEGEIVSAVDRSGCSVGKAKILRVQKGKNKTHILWLVVDKGIALEVRNVFPRGGGPLE